ncbi:glycosyltransferase [Paludibacter sp. 221]|uniref:glycosyltransferase n=1 Tax=Paludibacter sp. 221 TaxID=2302939 RepID=UPI0013D36B65|nr:glycosyltransferase [Paludibacter sp. 221]NDV46404.1 glycosyltransferase [Paludibacter sp. 221]
MKVLICPLNWGLGHATRCVPIIRRLIDKGDSVTVAADGFPLQFLQQEFPNLPYIEYSSYPISYSKGKSQVFAMLRCFPAIVRKIVAEHQWLKRIQATEHFDMVISDNRFGLWSSNTKSVYITHQLMVKMPKALRFMESVVWRLHRFFILKYDECWIPDLRGEKNLSGDLSHKYPLPANAGFIGALSRFSLLNGISPNREYETVVILSGVEPQRSIFEENMITRFANVSGKTLIVQGQPQEKKVVQHINGVTIVSHTEDEELAAILLGAKKIVSRSGYSTIMDLHVLGCLDKAEFIPTPGQTEQEYLAQHINRLTL